MKAIRNLVLACAVAATAAPALAQTVKVKQGMLNVPALSPLWLLPDEAKKHGIEIEMVMFQRFADARTQSRDEPEPYSLPPRTTSGVPSSA